MFRIVLFLSTILLFSSFSFAQTAQKSLATPSWKDQPLIVESFQIEGKTVKHNESFDASSDWLKSLKIKVKNVSSKTIEGFSANFSAVVPGKDKKVGFLIQYGITPVAKDSAKNILPGEEIEIELPEDYREAFREYVNRSSSLEAVTSFYLSIFSIYFSDKTEWTAGTYFSSPFTTTNDEGESETEFAPCGEI